MKKILWNLLICSIHIVCMLFAEALPAVTIICFSDYGYSLNIGLTVCFAVILGLHYFCLMCLEKRGWLCLGAIRTLLYFDCFVCTGACLAWAGFIAPRM